MIKTKNLIILAGVLLALVGIKFWQESEHQKETGSSATALVVSGEFNQENISRLILTMGSNSEPLILATGADGWFAPSYHQAKLDDQRVNTLLSTLSNLKGEFRSDSGKVLGDYGLLDDQAVTIRGLDNSGQEILAINIGQTAKGSPGQFVRIPGSDTVHLSQTGLLALLGIYGEPEPPNARFFLELQAVQENGLNVDGLKIRHGNSVLSFTKDFSMIEPAEGAIEGTEPTIDRNSWQWLLDQEPATDLAKSKVDGVLGSCVSIRANDVADPTAPESKYGLDNPTRSVSMNLQNGSELVLEFGNSREALDDKTASTYMRVSGNPTIWVVTEYTIKNIFKTRDELMPE